MARDARRQGQAPWRLRTGRGLAVQLGLIAGGPPPAFDKALLLVFAGDHGLTAEGVSAYPASVTRPRTVATFLAGKASANAFAKAVAPSAGGRRRGRRRPCRRIQPSGTRRCGRGTRATQRSRRL
ncbi:nicotinate-nucleotide--dimethylbenzimidazole phosphoribosyltransferase [Caulobacter segnis]